MNRCASVAVIAVLCGLSSFAVEPVCAAADTPPTVVSPTLSKTKIATTLTLKNGATTPGEKKTYEATLVNKANNVAVANKKVTFRLEGKNGTVVPNGAGAVGDATTDAEGKAHVTFRTPDLPQGAYALKASFAGDLEAIGDDAEANLFVAKATTHIELSEAKPFEAGSSILYVSVSLMRESDQWGLKQEITLSVNGKPQKLSGHGSYQIILMPLEAASWTLKVDFAGDNTAFAASGQRTYTKPKK